MDDNDQKSLFFCVICFLVLMENNDGLRGKHPDYVQEKMNLIGNDVEWAYSRLDRTNQQKVLAYYRLWGKELPEEIRRYEHVYFMKEFTEKEE